MLGHQQLAGAVGLRHVDREAEVDVGRGDQVGLAVDDVEADVHLRHRLERLDQRVADQVGEGHLAAAGAGEVVVDDGAVVPEQLDRDRADARWRSGTVSEASMFCDGAGRGAAQHGVASAGRWPRPGAAGLDSLGTGLVVPLAGSAALAVGARLGDGRRRLGLGGLGLRLRGLGLRGLGSASPAAAGAGGPSAAGRGARRCGAVGRRPLAAWPLPVPWLWKYSTQVGSTLPGSRLVLVVHLLHEPLVGAEVGGGLIVETGWPDDCGTGCFASSGMRARG